MRPPPLLRLLRWPGVLSAAADAATAGLLLAPCLHAGTTAAVVAAALAYGGGVALNDGADADRDATLHPERPIPSGQVSRAAAVRFAVLLLCLSPLAALAAHPAAAAGYAAVALCAVAYDLGLKGSAVGGALALGLCRGGSVCAAALAHEPYRELLRADPVRALLLPLPWFLHGVAVTLASVLEDRKDGHRLLPVAAAAVTAGPVAALVLLAGDGPFPRPAALLPFALLVPAVAWAAARAQRAGRPGAVGLVVREGVFGFLLLDAVALGARLPWPFAVAATSLWALLRWALRARRS